MSWAIVCPSGEVIPGHDGIATLEAARSVANDASWVCPCAQKGHEIRNEQTGTRYDRNANAEGRDYRNQGKHRCGICHKVGHDRRRCKSGIVEVPMGERHSGPHPRWFHEAGGFAVTCPNGHVASLVGHDTVEPAPVACACGWTARVALREVVGLDNDPGDAPP